jgi:PKD repeat protein
VTAINPAGQTSTARARTVWVDTVAPAVVLTVAGKPQVGRPTTASVSETDAPPPEPPAAASGIATATISWGDRVRTRVGRRNTHVYQRAGRYTIIVRVTDRAGNRTVVQRTIRVVAPPKRRGATPGTPKKTRRR